MFNPFTRHQTFVAVLSFFGLTANPCTVLAQGANAPEALHVICIAEVTKAFDLAVSLADLLPEFNDLSVYIDLQTGKSIRSKARAAKFDELMRTHVWPLQGLHARSLGTGFVVGKDRRSVLTSYDIASNCPMYSGSVREQRMQIAVLSEDGLRPIRASALGISQRFSASDDAETPLPKFICKQRDSDCSRQKPEELQKSQLEGGIGLARLQDEVKFWVPDLVVLNLDEPLKVRPVMLRPDDKIEAGSSLRYAGFPRAQQIAGMGTSNTVIPAERAKATVQSAIYSREVTIDNGADQIIAPSMRVKGTWFELSGTKVEKGNSGAPLYDPITGQVVGMVINDRTASPGQDGGKAVPVSQIMEYLSKAKVDFNVGSVVAAVPTAAPASMSTGAAVAAAPSNLDKSTDAAVPTLRERLLTGKSLAIAALLTLFVGMVAWLALRQRATSIPVVEPINAGMQPLHEGGGGMARSTKAAYFVTLRCVQSPLAPMDVLLPTPAGKDSVTVGKDPSICQVVFPEQSAEISGVHCRFTYESATHSLFVEDIQSTNGTFVNKRQLKKGEKVRLSNNDVVALARPDTNVFIVNSK